MPKALDFLLLAPLVCYCTIEANLLKNSERKSPKMQCCGTLRSLDGLRVGVTLLDSNMHDAKLCARQLIDGNVDACLRSTNTSVLTRLTSLIYQGVNITLVPLNDSVLGVWREGVSLHILSAPLLSFRTGRL